MKSNLTLSVGWLGGWLEIWRLRLISTQVVVEVEVGVELGNTLKIEVFRKLILFCKYLRTGSSYLYEILCGGQFLSCELECQIS